MDKHFVNIFSNEWEIKVAYQQNFPVGKKWQLFFWLKCFHWVSLLIMVSDEELKREDHISPFDNVEKFGIALFYK